MAALLVKPEEAVFVLWRLIFFLCFFGTNNFLVL